MNYIKIFIYAFIVLSVMQLTSCKANDEDYGNERVYLTKNMMTYTIQSSYFSSTPDENESKDIVIDVAGIFRSGDMKDASAVSVEIEEDNAYLEELLQEVGNPEIVQSTEHDFVADGQLLPSDCYTVGSLSLSISSNGYIASIPVTIHKEQLAKLSSFNKWLLPAFKIKSANIEILNPDMHALSIITWSIPTESLPDPLPSDWLNVALHKSIADAAPVWSDANAHSAAWVIDGNKDIYVNSNRYVPATQENVTIAPFVDIDLQGIFDIKGIKIYYQNEPGEEGASGINPRENCYIWAKVDGVWSLYQKITGNKGLTPNCLVNIEGATHIRIAWDLIVKPNPTYFLKVKEIEVYGVNQE